MTPEIDLSGTAHGQLATARRILTMDEFVALKDAIPQFEKEIRLPGDSRGETNTVFLFSVSGMLAGEMVRGALLAGECMLVQAKSLKMAERICREGLRDTAKHAFSERERRGVIEVAPAMDGLSVEAGGGKARPSEDGALLRTDPLMKSILASEIGKLPWKH